MTSNLQPVILLFGNDTTLCYLFSRFAERSGYRLTVNAENLSAGEIEAANPAAIIFLSTELLENTQVLVLELVSLEAPIMVCSSAVDEVRARELGADFCLLHPITYDGFQDALATATKRS
jgi:DNA-binding response OmpR family regulator